GGPGIRVARAVAIGTLLSVGAGLAGWRPGFLRAAAHWVLGRLPGIAGWNRWRRLALTLGLDLALSAARGGLSWTALAGDSPEARGRAVYFGAIAGAYLGLQAAEGRGRG